eukprot:491755-Amphidinium_carterae.1
MEAGPSEFLRNGLWSLCKGQLWRLHLLWRLPDDEGTREAELKTATRNLQWEVKGQCQLIQTEQKTSWLGEHELDQ